MKTRRKKRRRTVSSADHGRIAGYKECKESGFMKRLSLVEGISGDTEGESCQRLCERGGEGRSISLKKGKALESKTRYRGVQTQGLHRAARIDTNLATS